MPRKIISFTIILSLLMTMLLPLGNVFAADITYNVSQATKYKGTKDQNYNVYSTMMAIGANAGASFSIFVPEEKRYNIIARIGCEKLSTFTASINNEPCEAVSVQTGALGSYEEVLLNTTVIRQGYSTLDITCTSGFAQFTDVYIVEATAAKKEIDFSKKTGAYKNHWIPMAIEAEDFDFDGAVSVSGAAVKKQDYRKDSPLEIKADGLYNVVMMANGDSLTYTFNVSNSGVYDMSLFSTTSGTVHVYFDGNPGYVEAPVTAFAESSLGYVYLTEGVHTLKIENLSEAMNLDNIRFKTASSYDSYYKASDLTEGTYILIEEKEEAKTENPVWKEFWVSPTGSDKNPGTESSPFATVDGARKAIQKISSSMKGDIVVNVLPGTYFIDKSIDFTTADSGKNGYSIIYRGTDSDNKPILSGGKSITGWEKVDDKIWKAKVDEDIEMVRQLYINEYPARIARSKYTYRGKSAWDDPMTEFEQDGFILPKKNFPVLSNTDDTEMIFQFMWCLHYFPVKQITDLGDNWRIEYDQPMFGRYLTGAASHSTPSAGISLWIQNAPELMDEPGEFWYDKDEKTVYYYAFPEEDMTKAEVMTPVTKRLMTVTGVSKSDKVQNLTFDNLDIRHGAWNEITVEGLFVGQGDSRIDPYQENPQSKETWQYGRMFDQIEMNFADNISVTNCVFANHGSSVLAMRNCVTNSKIEGNVIRDVAGSGIVIGDIKYTNGVHTVEDTSRNISITNNVIRRVGHDYMGSIGIMVFYANSIDSMHNDIRYVPYTGISYGWGWGAAISNTLRCGEHMIANNRIDHSSQAVYDGGAIYTLSSQKGTYIQGNYMSNSPDSGGIYFDQGSANMVARDNVFEDNHKNTIYAGKLIWDVYRNYANYLDSGSSSPWYNGDEAKKAMVKERPVRTEGYNWGPEAKAIIANAGLQDGYTELLNADKVAYPEWRKMAIQELKPSKYAFESETEVTVWAADWIPGGEGVAYHDINDKEPEDYGKKGSGSFIGNTMKGEWVKYNLPINKTGTYHINFYYSLDFSGDEANASAHSGVTLYIDGQVVNEEVGLESTGSWNSYVLKYIGDMELTEGNHELKLEFSRGACAVERMEAVLAGMVGSDVNYDDGIMFKLQ